MRARHKGHKDDHDCLPPAPSADARPYYAVLRPHFGECGHQHRWRHEAEACQREKYADVRTIIVHVRDGGAFVT